MANPDIAAMRRQIDRERPGSDGSESLSEEGCGPFVLSGFRQDVGPLAGCISNQARPRRAACKVDRPLIVSRGCTRVAEGSISSSQGQERVDGCLVVVRLLGQAERRRCQLPRTEVVEETHNDKASVD